MKKSIKIILLSVAGIIALIAILPESPEEKPNSQALVKNSEIEREPEPKVDNIDLASTGMLNLAYTQLRLQVKEHLTSPKNADFPALLDIQYYSRNDSSYLIDSYVDTKNAYNADVRLKFTGEVKYIGGDYEDFANWEITRLEYE